MARTRNLRTTGRAASIEHRDLFNQRVQDAIEANKKAKEFETEYLDALGELQDLDPEGWEEWFDGRPEQTAGEMLNPIKERVLQLKCKHANIETSGGMTFSGGEVSDNIRDECIDCGAVL